MGHHIPALLPPILLPTPKLDKPRWRPRLRGGGPDEAADAQEPAESDALFAARGPLDEKRGRRSTAGRSKAVPAMPRLGGLTAQTLTDDTLRTLLIGQEDGLSQSS
jgi:hypothetical protein